MIELAAIIIGVPFVILTGIWWYHERTKESGWIDVAWTASVGIAGVWGALHGHEDGPGPRAWLYGAMAAAWALRLGAHLFARTRLAPDDPRYAKMRQVWGPEKAPLRMYFVLVYQMVAASLLALAVTAAGQASDGPIRTIDIAAGLLFAFAWVGEAVADSQMRTFRADSANHGGIIDTGLWAWSRHPNYFFEWLCWCAFAIGAFAGPVGAVIAAAPAPFLMFHLLHNVSGVPMLEKYLRTTRPEKFGRYAARVSKFFPRPPRSA